MLDQIEKRIIALNNVELPAMDKLLNRRAYTLNLPTHGQAVRYFGSEACSSFEKLDAAFKRACRREVVRNFDLFADVERGLRRMSHIEQLHFDGLQKRPQRLGITSPAEQAELLASSYGELMAIHQQQVYYAGTFHSRRKSYLDVAPIRTRHSLNQIVRNKIASARDNLFGTLLEHAFETTQQLSADMIGLAESDMKIAKLNAAYVGGRDSFEPIHDKQQYRKELKIIYTSALRAMKGKDYALKWYVHARDVAQSFIDIKNTTQSRPS